MMIINVIKNTRDPFLTRLPTIGSFSFVVAIELEVKNEQFCFCFVSQNSAVVENKWVLLVLVPCPEIIAFFFIFFFLGNHNSG